MSLLGLLTKKVTKILYNYHYNNPPQRASVSALLSDTTRAGGSDKLTHGAVVVVTWLTSHLKVGGGAN